MERKVSPFQLLPDSPLLSSLFYVPFSVLGLALCVASVRSCRNWDHLPRHELNRSAHAPVRHVPEVEPADHLAQAERAKLIELAGDRGHAAEDRKSVG